jgi:hypothetical protein
MKNTEIDIEEKEFVLEDYAKVAAALWAIQLKHGRNYTVRLVNSILRALEVLPKKR